MICTKLIVPAVLLTLALGCAEQVSPPPVVKVDMTLPERDATDGPQLLWVDIVQKEGTVQYRLRDKLVSEEQLHQQIKRLTSISASHPIVVDELENVGQKELDHLVTVLKAAGAQNISRRGENSQAVPLK